MAIEPISTMTAMQVQSTVKVQPVTISENTAKINPEQSTIPTMEDATPIVANVTESSTDNKQDSQREQRETTDSEALKKAVENINKNAANTEAVFGIHEGTNRVTIKLVDKETKKLIKELPPEKTLDMIARVWEMAGILVDEKR